MKRSIFIITALLVLLSLFMSAGSSLEVKAADKIKVVVGSDATWPPFESVDEKTKEIVGFDIDLIKAIGDKAGLDIEIKNAGFDAVLTGVSQCQYDAAISSITITDERKKNMTFSDEYFAAGQIVTVEKDNKDINSKENLAGKSVGGQISTTGVEEIKKIKDANLKIYDDIGLAYQDLMNGQIDAVVADNPVAMNYVSENPDKLKMVGEVFTSEFYGVAVCAKNKELVGLINKGLAEIKKNGDYDKIMEKWFPAAAK